MQNPKLKLLKAKVGEDICDPVFGKLFLDMTPKAQSIK